MMSKKMRDERIIWSDEDDHGRSQAQLKDYIARVWPFDKPLFACEVLHKGLSVFNESRPTYRQAQIACETFLRRALKPHPLCNVTEAQSVTRKYGIGFRR